MKKAIPTSFLTLIPVLLFWVMLAGCSSSQSSTEDSTPKPAAGIQGTWQTASMGYECNGTFQPEYYVQFTGSEIVYGHMKNGEFVPEFSDQIIHLEEISDGVFKIQAESSGGAQYTYRTSENDPLVLDYFGSWKDEDFPETYSGGASLRRCD